jgi:hypothetical protein
MSEQQPSVLIPVRILAVLLFLFGLFAFFGALFLWGEGFLFRFPQGVNVSGPFADLFVNAPASIIAAIGLWRLKRYGYVASQFVAGFYVYASVMIFVEMFQGGLPRTFAIYGPQTLAVLVAIALVFYLWRIRDLFE